MNWFKDENGNTIDNSEAVFAAIKAMRAITDEIERKRTRTITPRLLQARNAKCCLTTTI